MNNIQQERHINDDEFDVIVKISKRKDREKPYNYYHWQTYFEIIYVLDGEANLILEGKEHRLTYGSLTCINPYELHMTTRIPDVNCKMLVIQFNLPDSEKLKYGINTESRYLTPFMSMGKSRVPVLYPPFDCAEEICRIMDRVLDEAKNQNVGYKSVLRGYVLVLLGLLLRINGIENSEVDFKSSELSIEEVCRYIENNATNKLNLDVVAEEFGYSPVYFSKLFQKITGHSFKDYIDYILMRKAQGLLVNEGRTVGEVAELLEYSTASSFSRFYKRTLEKFNTVDPKIVKPD